MDNIVQILNSHKPLNYVVINLGINDTQDRFEQTPAKIAASMKVMIDTVLDAEIWSEEALSPKVCFFHKIP